MYVRELLGQFLLAVEPPLLHTKNILRRNFSLAGGLRSRTFVCAFRLNNLTSPQLSKW